MSIRIPTCVPVWTTCAAALAQPAWAQQTPCDQNEACAQLTQGTPCFQVTSTGCFATPGLPALSFGPPISLGAGAAATCDNCDNPGGSTTTLSMSQEVGVNYCIKIGIGVKLGVGGPVCPVTSEISANQELQFCQNTKDTLTWTQVVPCPGCGKVTISLIEEVTPVTITLPVSFTRTTCYTLRPNFDPARCSPGNVNSFTITANCGTVLYTATDTQQHIVADIDNVPCANATGCEPADLGPFARLDIHP
jgi:hypothetical protein